MRVRWCGRVSRPDHFDTILWITISWLNKQRTNKETMSKLPVPTPAWPCQTRRGIRNRITIQDLRLYPYSSVASFFQMYRQNSEKALWGGGGGQLPPCPPPPLSLATLVYPYQMIRRHELSLADHARHLAFCNWFRQRPPCFLESFVIGDEACFCMNFSLNTHNILQYAPRGEKPVEFSYEKKDCRQKLTVWIGTIGDGTLLGLFFFQQNINGERYMQMINDQIVQVLDERESFWRQQNGRFRHLWWAQDGAPPHRGRDVMARLQELFGDRIVALNQPVEWPPRSPDLTPLDFFLKAKVLSPPANLIELQERITREANDLREDRQLLRRVFRGMLHRAEKCLERHGGHVED